MNKNDQNRVWLDDDYVKWLRANEESRYWARYHTRINRFMTVVMTVLISIAIAFALNDFQYAAKVDLLIGFTLTIIGITILSAAKDIALGIFVLITAIADWFRAKDV